jgi:hypothetical protein
MTKGQKNSLVYCFASATHCFTGLKNFVFRGKDKDDYFFSDMHLTCKNLVFSAWPFGAYRLVSTAKLFFITNYFFVRKKNK